MRVEDILVRPNGNIVVVGVAIPGGDLRMTQLTPNGQLDSTFGSGGVATISLAPDSNEYVSGATLDPSGALSPLAASASGRLRTVTGRRT